MTVLVVTVIGRVVVGAPLEASPADVTVSINATDAIGVLETRLATQFVWPGGLDRSAPTRARFEALGAPLVRINATTIPCCAPGAAPMIPAGLQRGEWDFSSLDSVVNDVRAAGGQPFLTIAYAPEWMWVCPAGTIRDLTFSEFGDYMARLVGYYNAGVFTAEDGRTIANPAGIANRIRYWGLWNEPNLRSEGCPPAGFPYLDAFQYVAMWNAAVPKMLAIDPTIKLVGPTTAHAVTGSVPDYLPALVSGAVHMPDVVSFNDYGGWLNSQTDRFLFEGEAGCCGLSGIVEGLAQARAWAPAIPVWITEVNVNAAWDEDDPTRRPWTAFGAAWGASAFRRLALAGADVIFQYQFAHPDLRQFSLVDVSDGQPFLPYWRDYYLGRYFPQGSAVLAASSSAADIEVLAARHPGSSNISVLVVNRRLDGPMTTGGSGLPATVQVRVAGLARVTDVTMRMLDARTPVDTGPLPEHLPADKSATIAFSGYGAALLEFVIESPAIPGPPSARPPLPTP